MTKQLKNQAKLATILWFGVTAALLGFATVYIALKLSGYIVEPEPAKNTAPAKSTLVAPSSTKDTKNRAAQSAAPIPLNTNPPSQIKDAPKNKVGTVNTLPNNTTEIVKNHSLPVNVAGKQAKQTSLTGFNKGEMAGVLIRANPQDIPAFAFRTMQGETKNLSQWKGKIVLLNIWATWCVPCREEMPDLDQLKAKLGGADFDVVTISIDKGNLQKPAMFFQQFSIKNLTLYGAQSGRLTTLLRAPGLPATILIGRDGKEIARLIGPAKWGSNDAISLIKAAIGTKN